MKTNDTASIQSGLSVVSKTTCLAQCPAPPALGSDGGALGQR